jgi:hypothetical protein
MMTVVPECLHGWVDGCPRLASSSMQFLRRSEIMKSSRRSLETMMVCKSAPNRCSSRLSGYLTNQIRWELEVNLPLYRIKDIWSKVQNKDHGVPKCILLGVAPDSRVIWIIKHDESLTDHKKSQWNIQTCSPESSPKWNLSSRHDSNVLNQY